MARGQAQAAGKQLATTNAAAAAAGNTAGAIYGIEMPAVTNQIQNPGYDQATQNAIIGEGMNAANSAIGAAAESAGNRTAQTRNTAGYSSTLDDLAMKKAQVDADAAQKARIAIANNKQEQLNQGIQNASKLYGINQDTMARLYGYGPGTLEARAAGGGWTQGFSNVVGSLNRG